LKIMPELLSFGMAFCLAWLFGRAAWHKLNSPLWYEALLRSWDVKTVVSPAVAVRLLGGAELLCALLLLLPMTRIAGLLAAALLLVAYAMIMAWQLAAGGERPRCGCAGPGSEATISPALVSRNLVLASLALVASLPGASLPGGVAEMTFAAWVAAGLCGVFLALSYEAVENMIENSQKLSGAV
jgi:hypothetical protein